MCYCFSTDFYFFKLTKQDTFQQNLDLTNVCFVGGAYANKSLTLVFSAFRSFGLGDYQPTCSEIRDSCKLYCIAHSQGKGHKAGENNSRHVHSCGLKHSCSLPSALLISLELDKSSESPYRSSGMSKARGQHGVTFSCLSMEICLGNSFKY